MLIEMQVCVCSLQHINMRSEKQVEACSTAALNGTEVPAALYTEVLHH